METQARQHQPVITPEELAALQKPVLGATNLPPHCYYSEAAHTAEADRIFTKEWICVGRETDIPNPGDYRTKTIVGEPLIVNRNAEGEIRAHLNVCRHRGCKVMQDACGTTKSFKCPYHGWLYSLNGELRGAPDFKETVGFSKAEFGLFPVRVEVWEGFILVNLDADATPFADRVDDVDVFGMQHYGIGDQVTLHEWTFDLECNWKTYLENYIEAYHVPWVHKATIGSRSTLSSHDYHPDITPNQWDLICSRGPSMSLSDDFTPRLPVSDGLQHVPAQFQGLPVWACYPGFLVIPMLDCTLWHQLLPIGRNRLEVTMGLSFAPDVAEAYRSGDEKIRDIVDTYARNQEKVAGEDNYICQVQQEGLEARGAVAGRYCKHEVLAWKFDNWVARMAYTDDGAAAAPGGAHVRTSVTADAAG